MSCQFATAKKSCRRVAVMAMVLAVLAPVGAWAGKMEGGHYFRNLRVDVTVPEHCQQTELQDFHVEKIDFFTQGSEGATHRGFDREYPLDRGHARVLWMAFKEDLHHDKGYMSKIHRHPEMARDYEILLNNYEIMGFDFANEGEILELLAVVALEQELPEDRFVYGSVYYQDGVAGELDLVVARTQDCRVEAVGEAKLGSSIGKAHRQLARFKHFLHKHNVYQIFDGLGLTLDGY